MAKPWKRGRQWRSWRRRGVGKLCCESKHLECQIKCEEESDDPNIHLMCLQARNKCLCLNIALSPDLGGDGNRLLEGDQGLPGAREFCSGFRVGPEDGTHWTVGQTHSYSQAKLEFPYLKSDWHPHRRSGAAECFPTLNYKTIFLQFCFPAWFSTSTAQWLLTL